MEDGELMRMSSLWKVWDYGYLDRIGGRYEEVIGLGMEVRAELSNGNTEMRLMDVPGISLSMKRGQ